MKINLDEGIDGFVTFVGRAALLRGCSEREVEDFKELVRRHGGATVPAEYEAFLRVMGRECPVATEACARPLALDVIAEFYRYGGGAAGHFAVPLRDDQLVIGKPNALFSAGMYVLVTRGPDAGQIVWNDAWEEPAVARSLPELLYQMWFERSRDVHAEGAGAAWAVRHALETEEVDACVDGLQRAGLQLVLRSPSFWLLERDGTFARGSYARGGRLWACAIRSDAREALLRVWRSLLGVGLASLRRHAEDDAFPIARSDDVSP